MASFHIFCQLVVLGLIVGAHSIKGQQSTPPIVKSTTKATSAATSNSSKIVYNATKALLTVSRGILLELLETNNTKKAIDNVTLSGLYTVEPATEEKCTNPDSYCELHMQIQYNQPNVLLKLILKHNETRIRGYWEWSSLTIEGSAMNKNIDANTNGDMNVAPVPGYTQNGLADINCQRGYTACAPQTLSWTCDNEAFKSKDTKQADTLKITFPGLQLQPFFGNTSGTLKFGANWDCDPLISSVLWTSLLIGLALIIALLWPCAMLSSLYTPDKFDDPKGKPIMVPQTD